MRLWRICRKPYTPSALDGIGGRSAALIVPSAVITVERNVLLNPLHPHAPRIRILSEADFSFDPRLLN